jgi:hypothetical protein
MLSRELASVASNHVEASQIGQTLTTAYRWMFFAFGGLSGCAAVVAWSIPDLDLSDSPAIAPRTSSTLGDHR